MLQARGFPRNIQMIKYKACILWEKLINNQRDVKTWERDNAQIT